ncbi:hypothetical protein KCU61_g5051, partial [Aureobasidium melanogenum]
MADIQGLREQIAANFKFMEPADDLEIVILKRGRSYHAVIAQTNRVKHYLTMERPTLTVTAALEYLLDIISEHLGNIHDTCFAGRATLPTQFGETVENDLFLNEGSYYIPSEAPESIASTFESTQLASRESIQSESVEQVSIEITHLRHIEVSLLRTDFQHHLQVQLHPLVEFELELLDDVLPRRKALMHVIQHEATLCAGVHASGELETSHEIFTYASYLLDL